MLTINGQSVDAAGKTVAEYLAEAGYNTVRIAVERNEEIVPKAKYAETVLAGENEVSGQSLPDFAQIFDRIYVPTTPEQLPALREALAESPAELIPILSAPIEDGPYLIGS
jgi:sulfur carrier protein